MKRNARRIITWEKFGASPFLEYLDRVIALFRYSLNLTESDVQRAKQATKHLIMKQQDGNALLMEDLESS